MTVELSLVRSVSVITTGSCGGHPEHLYGTRKPALWWIFTSKQWVKLPLNVFVIEHAEGLVLFDTGADRAVVTDEDYWPDKITRMFMRNIFRWDIGEDDTLTLRLKEAGYAAIDVRKAVLSHLHMDHAGGIAEIPQADLYVSEEAWEHMLGAHPEREGVLRRDIVIPGAKWNTLRFVPTSDPDLAPFTEACDLMGDGSLIVLKTPGHLAGSVSLLVNRAEAPPLLLIGDLTYAEELLERDQMPGTGDKKLLRESFAKVRELKRHRPELVILAGHDQAATGKLEAAQGAASGTTSS